MSRPIGEGRSYLAFESLGVADDFLFTASSGGRQVQSGESLALNISAVLSIHLPNEGEVRILHNGEVIHQQAMTRQDGLSLQIEVKVPGTYRVEATRHQQIWIVANPIYIEVSGPAILATQ